MEDFCFICVYLCLSVANNCVWAAAPAPPIRFREVAASAGISFVLENHPTDRKHMIETMPGGIAVFDYDGDGRPDIYFTNGADIPSLEKSSPKYWNRLYRNEGNWKFRDVTEQAGVAGAGYSMGAAVGGLRQRRPPRPLRRRRQPQHSLPQPAETAGSRTSPPRPASRAASGRWLPVGSTTIAMASSISGWSTTPNGRLPRTAIAATPPRGIRIYCHPKYFTGLANSLYRNRGDGTFEDVTAKAGLAKFPGRGMSVAFADYDGDGWPDVFVTNDNMPNFLFHNLGNGTFEEVALAGRRRTARRRQAGCQHGRRVQGLRQRRPARHLRHRAGRRNLSAVPQRRQRQLHRRHAKIAARAADLTP